MTYKLISNISYEFSIGYSMGKELLVVNFEDSVSS